MPHTPQPGTVVLVKKDWNHESTGRPHLVLETDTERGLLLCPLSSTVSTNHGLPIPRRPGGPRCDSYLCANDGIDITVNNLQWTATTCVVNPLYRLTPEEFNFALVEVRIQQVERQAAQKRQQLLAARRNAIRALQRL